MPARHAAGNPVYLFDTNVLSELTRVRPNEAVVRKLLSCDHGMRFASEMTRYELRFGAALRPDRPELWPRIQADIIPRCRWIPIDDEVSLQTADLVAGLQLQGRRLEWSDVVIAATALVHGLIVVTRNLRHFERIEGLMVEDWFPPTA